jgi:hypothetical protein
MNNIRNEIPITIEEVINNLDELIFWYSKEKINKIIKKEEENKDEKSC